MSKGIDDKKIWRLANLTTHDQSEFVDEYKSRGYNIDPSPRPIIKFKNDSQEDLVNKIRKHLTIIKDDGYDAILLGGTTDMVPYIYCIAGSLGLKPVVVIIKKKYLADHYEQDIDEIVVMLDYDQVVQ